MVATRALFRDLHAFKQRTFGHQRFSVCRLPLMEGVTRAAGSRLVEWPNLEAIGEIKTDVVTRWFIERAWSHCPWTLEKSYAGSENFGQHLHEPALIPKTWGRNKNRDLQDTNMITCRLEGSEYADTTTGDHHESPVRPHVLHPLAFRILKWA